VLVKLRHCVYSYLVSFFTYFSFSSCLFVLKLQLNCLQLYKWDCFILKKVIYLLPIPLQELLGRPLLVKISEKKTVKEAGSEEVVEEKVDDAQPEVVEAKVDDAQPEVVEAKVDDAQPEVAEAKVDDAQPEVVEAKVDNSQPEES